MKYLLLFLHLFPISLLGQIWQNTYPIQGAPIHLTHSQEDFVLISKSTDGFYSKTIINEEGPMEKTIEYPFEQLIDVQDFKDAGVLALDTFFAATDSVYGIRLREITDDGEVLWVKTFFHSDSISILDGILHIREDHKIFLVARTHRMIPSFVPGKFSPETQLLLYHLDETGAILWQSNIVASSDLFYSPSFEKILIAPDGRLHIFGPEFWNGVFNGPFLKKVQQFVFDDLGTFLQKNSYTADFSLSGVASLGQNWGDALIDDEGKLYLTGSKFVSSFSGGSTYLNLQKRENFENATELIYEKSLSALDGGNLNQSAYGIDLGLACQEELFVLENHESQFNFIVKRDELGEIISSTLINTLTHYQSQILLGLSDGIAVADFTSDGDLRLTRANCNGFFKPSLVHGRLFLDANQNCLFDVGEKVIPNTSFYFEDKEYQSNPNWIDLKYRLKTDEFGEFMIAPEIGSNEISEIEDLLQIITCEPSYSFTLENIGDSIWLDIPYTDDLIGSIQSTEPRIDIYPNPVIDEELFIDLSKSNFSNPAKLFIKNINGQVVMQKTFSNNTSLQLNIPSGIYFLYLEVEAQLFLRKIIKL